MDQIEKFHFDTGFGESESSQHPATRPKTRFNAAEVEEIRDQAYADGRTGVEAKAAEACAQALSDAANSLNALLERLATAEHQYKTHAFNLALMIARKIARRALESHPEKEIESLVQECLTKLPCEPRIVITVADHLKEVVEPQLMQLVQNQSFSGNLSIMGSNDMIGAECAVEWSEGGMKNAPEDLGEAIETIIHSRLAAENPSSEQGDLFDQ